MQPSQASLARVLGLWMATAIVVGTVIGSGVFKKARNVAENAPEFGLGISVWVLGGILTLFGAFAIAEVAVLFPRAGGNYVFLREGYGRWAGFLWGWVDFGIIRSASIAALATMFTESFHDVLRKSLYPDDPAVVVLAFWPRQLLTVLVIAGLTLVNVRGTRLGGGVQLFITCVKVGSLLFVITLPFVVLAVVSEPQHPPRLEHLSPAWPGDWLGVNWGLYGAALVGVLWAYNGWMNLGPVAEEIKNPRRNIPLGLFLGVLILIGLYCGANVAYYLVMPRADIAATPTDTAVATVFCTRLLGPIGGVIGSAMIMTSVFGALNGNLLVGPRLLFAMGRDRLIPRHFEDLHPRWGTPVLATAVIAGWACVQILVGGVWISYPPPEFELFGSKLDLSLPAGKPLFDMMTDFAIFGSATFETLAVASIFLLRWKIPPTPENRPYRCWGYPLVPLMYVLIMAAVVVNMFVVAEQRAEALVGAGFIAVGALVYVAAFRGGRRP
jgi:amino acid transporter